MKCPQCGVDEDKVLDSRAARDGAAIRRRRECVKCGHRWTTYEEIDRDELIVVKRDGSRQQFSRQKLERGLFAACRKRPVPPERIHSIIDGVLAAIPGDEVSTERIGELVMQSLLSVDEVAYIRFASVYRGFSDVNQFLAIITELKK